MKIKTTMNTPCWFFCPTETYTAGEGTTMTWNQFTTGSQSAIWVEWRGSFGDQRIAASAQGIMDSARIRMSYIPALYELIRTKKVVIIKNIDASAVDADPLRPKPENPNTYTLWGGVDNIQEACQWMEFNVKRFEAT